MNTKANTTLITEGINSNNLQINNPVRESTPPLEEVSSPVIECPDLAIEDQEELSEESDEHEM